MRDMTDTLIARHLSIAHNGLASAQHALDMLTELLVGAEPTAAESVPTCQHPRNQREDLTTMGEQPGSRWACRVCGYRFPEEAP